MKNYLNIILFILTFLLCLSCSETSKKKKLSEASKSKQSIKVPNFNADSAFKFVEQQLDFGPRVPNTKSQRQCARFLESTLKRFSDNVITQRFKARAFDGVLLDGYNIIASFSPEKKARILLCAHWDSRPFADHDPDPLKRDNPIDGANDGASGVGVLLEIARQLKTNKPRIGVDIILFDLEDYGPKNGDQSYNDDDLWGLGSQYWSKNTHVFNYKARFSILLDMVGISNPTFRKEGFSMHYAADKVNKVWDIAEDIGYGEYFLDERGGFITDDHYYINEIKGIPAINIIHLDPKSLNGSFFEHWHTTQDIIDFIDKETLDIVGTTILTVVFRE